MRRGLRRDDVEALKAALAPDVVWQGFVSEGADRSFLRVRLPSANLCESGSRPA